MPRIPKMIPNPEYPKYREEQIKQTIADFRDCEEDYYPEEHGKLLPEDGAWIILLCSVRVGRNLGDSVETITVPHLSMWFAMPTEATAGGYHGLKPKKAVIQTPQGEVCIWPHEYNIVSDISPYLSLTEEEGFHVHYLNESAKVNVDRLFYVMSRGIAKGEAQKLLLPEIKDPYFCYFTLHEAYSEYFGEGFGTGRLYPVNHERRDAAQKRKAA